VQLSERFLRVGWAELNRLQANRSTVTTPSEIGEREEAIAGLSKLLGYKRPKEQLRLPIVPVDVHDVAAGAFCPCKRCLTV